MPADAGERMPASGGMTEVLDWLAAGPRSPDFQRAFDALHGSGTITSEEDRAQARHSMPSRRWYVPVLVHYDPFRVEDLLREVFSRIVIPDLGVVAVLAEVAGWAASPQTPSAVVRALIASAYETGDNAPGTLHSILGPAVYRRWLAEHAVYLPPRSAVLPERVAPLPTAARTESVRRPSAPGPARNDAVGLAGRVPWRLPASERTAALASVLIWLCVILIIVVVLMIVL